MRRIAALFLTAAVLLLTGCYSTYQSTGESRELVIFTDESDESAAVSLTEPLTEALTEALTDAVTEAPAEEETAEETEEEPELETAPAAESEPETDYPPEADETLPASVEKDGSYTSPEDVAEYIHTFGTLPANFITKRKRRSSAGSAPRAISGMLPPA